MNGRLSATVIVSRIDCILDFGFIHRRYNGTSGGRNMLRYGYIRGLAFLFGWLAYLAISIEHMTLQR